MGKALPLYLLIAAVILNETQEQIITISLTRDTYTVYENDGSVEVCVNITAGIVASDYIGVPLPVRFTLENTPVPASSATAGMDYIDVGTVTLSYGPEAMAGDLTCLNITILHDTVPEDDEYFRVTIQTTRADLVNVDDSSVIKIIDNGGIIVDYGRDPHFSILLQDNKQLCYSVQGKSNGVFNLISCTEFLINAKFVAASKREEVTWMGSIGVVINKALHYGGSKVTHFRFDAKDRTIYIGDKLVVDASTIRELTSENSTISILERNRLATPIHHSGVKVHLKDVGLYFTVTFEHEHLDMRWQSTVKRSNSHGLIGQFYHKGVAVDEVRKLLIMPNKDPVPVEWRPVWRFMEKRRADQEAVQHCWVAMNLGNQGRGLIDGHYLDYLVENVISSGFQFVPSTKN